MYSFVLRIGASFRGLNLRNLSLDNPVCVLRRSRAMQTWIYARQDTLMSNTLFP